MAEATQPRDRSFDTQAEPAMRNASVAAQVQVPFVRCRVHVLLTAAGAAVVALGAPWLLRLFGPEYARYASALLRWLAAAAPFAVLTQLYFTRLRVQKRIGRLVLLSAIIAAATLGLSAALMSRHGIAASGIGWLLGNALVAAIALLDTHRQRADLTGLPGPDPSGDPAGQLG